MDVNCASCGKPLSRPPSRVKTYKHQFCGTKCHDAFRLRRVITPCAICGKEISTKASLDARGPSTCGPECLSKLRAKNTLTRWGRDDYTTVACGVCGKIVTRRPSHVAKFTRHFCSVECKTKGRGSVHPVFTNGFWKPCETCGKPVWRTPATLMPHVFCSRKCARITQGCIKPNYGHDNPAWRGGVSLFPYGDGFTKELKMAIKRRDNWRCQICGKSRNAGLLAVHHIDFSKTNHDPSNLISLCLSCHRKVHWGSANLPVAG